MSGEQHMSAVSTAEFPRILEIWEAAVRATHDFLTETDIDFFRPLVLNEAFPAVHLACVRDACDRILGFIGTTDGTIEMLFIDPAFHRRGIGRQLVNYAVNTRGCRAVDVNEQNPQALAFYLGMGFEVRSRSEVDAFGKPFPILHLALPEVPRTSTGSERSTV
jgi:putative acetyltransferase